MAVITLTEMLGLSRLDALLPMSLVTEVEHGLSLVALDRLASAIAPDDASFPFRLVPRATLARRRKQATARMSADESARVARLAEVWTFACQVWGSEDAARSFLFRPHAMLEGRRPIDVVLANEFGRPLVDGILGRLQYGAAA